MKQVRKNVEESSVFEHREYAETIKASRDNIKIQKKSSVYGVQFVLLGLESQEHIHYAMPMRVMGMIMAHIKSSMTVMQRNIRQRRG